MDPNGVWSRRYFPHTSQTLPGVWHFCWGWEQPVSRERWPRELGRDLFSFLHPAWIKSSEQDSNSSLQSILQECGFPLLGEILLFGLLHLREGKGNFPLSSEKHQSRCRNTVKLSWKNKAEVDNKHCPRTPYTHVHIHISLLVSLIIISATNFYSLLIKVLYFCLSKSLFLIFGLKLWLKALVKEIPPRVQHLARQALNKAPNKQNNSS